MAKPKTTFGCTDCGATAPVWSGRCPGCDAWSTMAEERAGSATGGSASVSPSTPAQRIGEVSEAGVWPLPTGVRELDRVLGGGVVPGSVLVLGGEPGIGKSTLLLQVASGLARVGVRTLYVTAEEAASQVRGRADRLGAVADDLWLTAETSLPKVLGHLDEIDPQILVLDSIQTVHDPALASAPGSVGQVRECAHRLVEEARRRGCAVLLVGHVTKEGSLAGPRVLEHLVDTVLSFEGDRHHGLRLLRAVKHRFGGTGELGVFEMTSAGLESVDDPSALFLSDRRAGAAGSCVVPLLDGGRPLLVEVQALLAPSEMAQPRRQTQGFDAGRLGLLLAVLRQRAGVSLEKQDVWVTVVGGVRTVEPALDLAVCMAIASSVTGRPVAGDLVACGEVGLGGELRQVGHLDRRLSEAARLGFRTMLVPASCPGSPPGTRRLPADDVAEAIRIAGIASPSRRPDTAIRAVSTRDRAPADR